MREILFFMTALCFTTLLADAARAQDRFEVFGGYSYMHSAVPFTETQLCPGPPCAMVSATEHPSLNGWESSGVFNLSHGIGLTADFTGHYGLFGTFQGATGSSARLNTYLFGPQFRFGTRVSPFMHALFGGAHETIGNGGAESGGFVVIPTSSNGLAAAFGGGLDIKISRFLWVRPIQLDYLATRFRSATQSQFRFSAGLAVHF